MSMNPETGEGFDAVKVDESVYFDPNATDATYPGSVGLEMRKSTYWQGDVQFDTFETAGPKFGPKWPDGTMRVSGLGTDTDVWGLSTKDAPPPGYAPWLHNGVPGAGTAGGTNIFTPARTTPDTTEFVKHEWTPCFEDDGSPTLGDFEQRGTMDITILGAYGGDIKIPVMPEEFGADFTHEYWTPRVVGLGEIILPGGQSMETISWDSFFPRHYDSDYCNISPLELEDPKSLTARIIWTMRFKMNCMLIVGGGIWNDQVVITNFNYRHKAGEIDDIYYTISCKRYRAPVVSTSPNPDAGKDRWYKDPRRPGGGIDPVTDLTTQTEDAPPRDPNPDLVPIEPGEPSPPNDVVNPGIPGRNALITIETDTVKPWAAPLPRGYGSLKDVPGETFQMAVNRLAKVGPNTMANMLELNQWVTDNNYNPYTSNLIVGSGIRFYKETAVTAGKPTTMIGPQPVTGYPGSEGYPKTTGLDLTGSAAAAAGNAIGGAFDALGNAIQQGSQGGNVPGQTPVERPQFSRGGPVRR